MMWIPFWAGGVINGLGHCFGYRNFEPNDASTNVFPWGLLIGGEELHNNHHAFPASAKLSVKWWELDMGWFYIRLLQLFRLALFLNHPVLTTSLAFPDLKEGKYIISDPNSLDG